MKYIVNLGIYREGARFINDSTNYSGYLPPGMLPDGAIVTLKEEHDTAKGWFSINEDRAYYPIDLLIRVPESKTSKLLSHVRNPNAC